MLATESAWWDAGGGITIVGMGSADSSVRWSLNQFSRLVCLRLRYFSTCIHLFMDYVLGLLWIRWVSTVIFVTCLLSRPYNFKNEERDKSFRMLVVILKIQG